MRVRLVRWNKSLVLRLPKLAIERQSLSAGEWVDVDVNQDRLVLRAGNPRYRLVDLVAEIDADSIPDRLDDRPMGNETL